MPTLIDQAIVLRHWEFSETSQTVALLARAHGRLKGIAKGARRENAKFGGGFELLTRGELVAIVKPGVELATLTEWDLQEIFWPARRDLLAHHAGMYLVDLAHHAIVDQDPHPGLFDALLRALRRLGEADAVRDAVLRFQWDLLTEVGLRPRLGAPQDRQKGGVYLFDPRAGGIGGASAPPAPGGAPVWRVRESTVDLLRVLESPDPAFPTTPAHRQAVARATRLLAEFLKIALDREPPSQAPFLALVTGANG
ncbi:MAG TPA: DNA repair protein RecO [Phycisphaerales bacterium]|nr:DNA repair protein RecO [Phycisphaerales bacterium]